MFVIIVHYSSIPVISHLFICLSKILLKTSNGQKCKIILLFFAFLHLINGITSQLFQSLYDVGTSVHDFVFSIEERTDIAIGTRT